MLTAMSAITGSSIKMKNKKVIISIILTVAILSAAGVFYAKGGKQDIKVPQSPEDMRAFMDSNDFKAMDEESRKEFMHKAMEEHRKVMEEHMNKQLDEYFALPIKDRTAYLDEAINRMEQMRNQWRDRRGSDKKDGEQRPPREARKAPSAEKMRERTESMDPQRLAQMAEFMKAMHERMEERGIKGGGPGGGPGGMR